MKVVYTAWFRNLKLDPDDQDYEWPACFVIDAPDEHAAQAWGDYLSRSYAVRRGEAFLRSGIEAYNHSDDSTTSLPVVLLGDESTDEEIGW